MSIEHENVHKVYDEIADHFSTTRYKIWPTVERFLNEQKDGSIGLDLGCGNGKNMMNKWPNISFIGMDTCFKLGKICMERDLECVQGNMIDIPFRSNCMDFLICIASLHHLYNRKDRINTLREIKRILCCRNGEALIFVWSKEESIKRTRGMKPIDDNYDGKNVLVPWTVESESDKRATYYRFYHLYEKGDLEIDAKEAGLTVKESGFDKENWYIIVKIFDSIPSSSSS